MPSLNMLGLLGTTVYDPLLAKIIGLTKNADDPDRQSLLVLQGSRGSGKTSVLHYLATAFPEQASSNVVLGPFDANDYTVETFIQVVWDAVSSISASANGVLVLFDNLDKFADTSESPALYTFEQDVLVTLVQRKNTVVLATSPRPIIWRDWETRSRHEALRISYLSRSEVEQAALRRGIDPQRAYWLTLGHPEILQWLFSKPKYTESEIAERATKYFLEKLPAATAESAILMSLLPSFDVGVLRHTKPLGESANDDGYFWPYLDYVHNLIAAGLLRWSEDVGGYRFCDSVVRCQLARYFRAGRPDAARCIHRDAANYYESEATRVVFLNRILIDAIYHLVYCDVLAGVESKARSTLQWINSNMPEWVNAHWDDMIDTWHTGAGDWVIKFELSQCLGADDMQEISTLLERNRTNSARLQ